MSKNSKPDGTVRVRTDHEGRAKSCAAKCNCKPARKDRTPLAAPRTLGIERLIKLCDDIYVNRTVTELSDQDRRDLEILLVVLDGEPIKKPYNQHPIFLAGIVRYAFQSKGAPAPAPAKRDATPATPTTKKVSDEVTAKQKMREASASAWRKQNK